MKSFFGWYCHWMKLCFGWKCQWMNSFLDESVFWRTKWQCSDCTTLNIIFSSMTASLSTLGNRDVFITIIWCLQQSCHNPSLKLSNHCALWDVFSSGRSVLNILGSKRNNFHPRFFLSSWGWNASFMTPSSFCGNTHASNSGRFSSQLSSRIQWTNPLHPKVTKASLIPWLVSQTSGTATSDSYTSTTTLSTLTEDAPSDRLSVSDSPSKSRLGDHGPGPIVLRILCWSRTTKMLTRLDQDHVRVHHSCPRHLSRPSKWEQMMPTECWLRRVHPVLPTTIVCLVGELANLLGMGDAVGGSIESGSVDGTALLPSPTQGNTCTNAPEKLEMTTMTLSCDRRHRFRVNRNRFETWGQPSLAGTATLPHSMAWDGARQTGISGMDPPFSATWSVCGKNWALDVMLRRPWLLPIPTSCVLYWLPHPNCFLSYICLLRPGLNRPGLSRPGLSWKKRLA